MSKIAALLMVLFILGGCATSKDVNKEEINEKTETMDFIYNDLETFTDENYGVEQVINEEAAN